MKGTVIKNADSSCELGSRMRSSPSRSVKSPSLFISDISLSRSEEHTSELQSRLHLVCRLLLEKKKNNVHLEVVANDKRRRLNSYHTTTLTRKGAKICFVMRHPLVARCNIVYILS